MPRVLNRYHGPVPGGAVWIMRPSKWGNPFSVGRFGRERCIELYREYLLRNHELMADLEELRGKDLVCCCAPKPCHGDVLLYLANRDTVP